MKYLIYVVFALLVITAFPSCKKDNTAYYNLSDTQKNFGSFKEGSYWIMKDSLTGHLDSLVVINIEYGYYTPPEDQNSRVEEKTFFINQYDLSSGIKNDTFLIDLRISGTGIQALEYNKNYSSYITGMFFDLNYTYNNISINSIVYNNVVYNNKSITLDGILYNMAAYIDGSNILLKILYTDNNTINHVWELEKSNIIRI